MSNQTSSPFPTSMAPAMALALAANFGSVERWREEFIVAAQSSGAVRLAFNPRNGTLANKPASDDSVDAIPILEVDLHGQGDLEAVMQQVDWQTVYDRYQSAVHDATEGFAIDRAEISNAQLVDVRRAGVFEQAKQMIPGASWRDPASVNEWAGSLPSGQEVVVYCVYGHEVGRATALRLRAQGVDARFLRGGIDGWAAAGLPVVDKAQVRFEASPDGTPAGWECGSTGGGSPRWSVEAEATGGAPVLKQSGSGRFPWCVKSDTSVADGWVEVRFKPLVGKQDQAGGIVWRFKDGDNYYVARANALEDNVSLYYTKGGTRHTIKYVNAPVPSNAWHTLRVEFEGTKIRVSLDGRRYIEEDDRQIAGSGKVGVWTKADSVTVFDAFSFGAAT